MSANSEGWLEDLGAILDKYVPENPDLSDRNERLAHLDGWFKDQALQAEQMTARIAQLVSEVERLKKHLEALRAEASERIISASEGSRELIKANLAVSQSLVLVLGRGFVSDTGD